MLLNITLNIIFTAAAQQPMSYCILSRIFWIYFLFIEAICQFFSCWCKHAYCRCLWFWSVIQNDHIHTHVSSTVHKCAAVTVTASDLLCACCPPAFKPQWPYRLMQQQHMDDEIMFYSVFLTHPIHQISRSSLSLWSVSHVESDFIKHSVKTCVMKAELKCLFYILKTPAALTRLL